jgi:hypothetical protein
MHTIILLLQFCWIIEGKWNRVLQKFPQYINLHGRRHRASHSGPWRVAWAHRHSSPMTAHPRRFSFNGLSGSRLTESPRPRRGRRLPPWGPARHMEPYLAEALPWQPLAQAGDLGVAYGEEGGRMRIHDCCWGSASAIRPAWPPAVAPPIGGGSDILGVDGWGWEP